MQVIIVLNALFTQFPRLDFLPSNPSFTTLPDKSFENHHLANDTTQFKLLLASSAL